MTKLYHEAGSWIVPGKQSKGKAANRADVPNSPDELAAWLNDRGVSPTSFEAAEIAHQRSVDAAIQQRIDDDPLGLDRPTNGAGEPPPASSTEHAEARRMAIGRCPRCNGTPRGAHLLLKGEEKDAILNWIDDADELWMIEAIAIAVRDRVRALGLAIGEEGTVQ